MGREDTKREKGGKKIPNQSKQEGKREKEKTPPNKLSQGKSPFKKKLIIIRRERKGEKGKTKSNNISLVLFWIYIFHRFF